MTNLTIKEQEHVLRHLNYDLSIATQGLRESMFCSTDVNNTARHSHKLEIPKHKIKIEFLTTLINKL
jgi:hypothetical protein